MKLNYKRLLILGLLIIDFSNPAFSQEKFACGPECFKFLLKHFGTEVSDNQIIDSFDDPFNDEMLAKELINAAKKFDFEGHILECNFNELSKNPFPCIVQINNHGKYHYISLLGMNSNTVMLQDPGEKPIVLNKTTFENIFTGYAVYLLPENNIKKSLLTPKSVPIFVNHPSEIIVLEDQEQYIVPFEIMNINSSKIDLRWHESNCGCMEANEFKLEINDTYKSQFILHKEQGWENEYYFYLESKDFTLRNRIETVQIPILLFILCG